MTCVLRASSEASAYTAPGCILNTLPGQESGLLVQSVLPSCMATGVLLSEELQHGVWQRRYQGRADKQKNWTEPKNFKRYKQMHCTHFMTTIYILDSMQVNLIVTGLQLLNLILERDVQ